MSIKCISCGTSPAYISFMGNCECSNRLCKFYSKELYPPPDNNEISTRNTEPPAVDYNEIDRLNEDDQDPGIRYYWVTHHHDFGD